MGDDDKQRSDNIFHYEGGVPIFNARLDEVERKQADAEAREKTYRDQQLSINKWMMKFTGMLVVLATLTGVINGIYTAITKISAEAAKSAADTAQKTLGELQKGGSDTHELAVQAKNQADRTKDIADRALAQTEATNKLAILAQKTYDASQRPYVGVLGVLVEHWADSNGSIVVTPQPTARSDRLHMMAQFKNFGPVPGRNFTNTWKVLLGGASQPAFKVPDRPSTIFPGQVVYLDGTIGRINYPAIMSGQMILALELSVDYDTPSQHIHECEKEQYSPDQNGFFSLGPLCEQ